MQALMKWLLPMEMCIRDRVLHCSQVAYGMYELGKRKLPIERLITLAKFYHVSLDSLTGLSRE